MARQFLEILPIEEAQRRWRDAVRPLRLGCEEVPLASAVGRVLGTDVHARRDVPGFDRSNVDGFALRAADTFTAEEFRPRPLQVVGTPVTPGEHPRGEVAAGQARPIATGAMVPRGADAVVMIEHTEMRSGELLVQRAAAPGANISFAGSDLASGEQVLRAGTLLSARETGTLAALGVGQVNVVRRPRVAVLSTGNEIVAPGAEAAPGQVHDVNQRMLADTLSEHGCEAIELGVVEDDPEALTRALEAALVHDCVVMSGGTSKGEGDHGVTAVRALGEVLVHGVALKPGKPLCLAVARGKPVAVLPGFPTSAIFTFHTFVLPLLRTLAGLPETRPSTRMAVLPVRVAGDRGRTVFELVSLLTGPAGLLAYPIGKGSGSVTTFARADGFVTVDRQQEYLEAGVEVPVTLLGDGIEVPDLVVIGSQCTGFEALLACLQDDGITTRSVAVGSLGGFRAAERGECDVAGVHLCDGRGIYNRPFLRGAVVLVRGYDREQGLVSRHEEVDPRTARMVNRNRGSGTRVLIDEVLGTSRPPGYSFEVRSHHAVAAAVAQERADWGVAIRSVATAQGLNFRPLRSEQYDFVIPTSRWQREPVQALMRLLGSKEGRERITAQGFSAPPEMGQSIA